MNCSAEWNWVKVEDVNASPTKAPLQRAWSETCSPNSKPEDGGTSVYTIPTSTQGPEYFAGAPQDGTKTLLIVMVGLPARGKTFLAQKLCRLLGWHGITSQVFNVQVAWKEKLKARLHLDATLPVVTAAKTYREVCTPGSEMRSMYTDVLRVFAREAQEFYSHGGVVVVLNDDFTTKDLRDEVDSLFSSLASSTIFVEVVRDNTSNATFDRLKVSDPDEYPQLPSVRVGGSLDDFVPTPTTIGEATRDFHERVHFLEERYDSLEPDTNRSYIKIRNDILEVHRVQGFLGGRIVSFLMNLSQFKVQHPIYFVRHGQSMYNLEDRLGGDPVLTPKGEQDALSLLDFIQTLKADEDLKHTQPENAMQIWTSQLKRAIQTAQPSAERLGIKVLRWSSLNEIHAGVCENLTYKEMERDYPLIHRFRGENKYTFRYPQGESYQDLVMRLEPVIMELENANRVVVVVAHQAVLRALLAYFGSTSAESSVYVEVPHRTVWRCTYSSKGIATVDMVKLGAPAKGDGCKD